jgi:CheY-like chemotaxis protein
MNRTVLLADDHPQGLEVMVMLLEARGFAVTSVADGALALQSALQLRPDVVMLDLSMPSLSGEEVARAIRAADTPGWTPRIIALSGHAAPRDDAMSLFDAYLQKPVTTAAMLQALE